MERENESSSRDEMLDALMASIMRANAYAESIGMKVKNVEDKNDDDKDHKNN